MQSSAYEVVPENLFSKVSLWQSWLDVESALALAQAELNIIPMSAAQEICAKANVHTLGIDNLEREAHKTQAPILALTRVLSEAAGESGHYVHWGATTQNIMQTGRLLLMRKANQQLKQHLAKSFLILSSWAEQYARAPMIARTNGQHALPVSFGFKVAGWIEALARDYTRIKEMEKRVFVLPFGGSVGAMHAFGNSGLELNEVLARKLNLEVLLVPSRTVNDIFADYVVQLSLWACNVERISTELYRLMSTEIAEVSEKLEIDVVGSSTMPHKVNPKHVVKVIAQAADLRLMAATAMQGTLSAHEGDASANHLISRVIDRFSPLSIKLSSSFAHLLSVIEISSSKMLANLQLQGASVATEHLMMALAPNIGRGQAHDLLHELLHDHDPAKCDLATHFATSEAIARHIAPEQIAKLMDPLNYLGDSVRISESAAAMARKIAKQLV